MANQTQPGALPSNPILDLSTLVERRYIAIDQVPRELRAPGQLAPLEHARIAHLLRMLDLLNAKGLEASAQDVAASTRLLGEVCSLVVVDLAPEVLAGLAPGARAAIVDCFLGRSRNGSPTASGLGALATNPATGALSPRALPGSTAGRSAAGSRRRSSSSTPRSKQSRASGPKRPSKRSPLSPSRPAGTRKTTAAKRSATGNGPRTRTSGRRARGSSTPRQAIGAR